jgi:predicted ATP-grasp superfamily ATP-dependent carboligase
LGLSLNNGRDVIIPGCCYCLRPSETSNTGFVHFVNLDSLKAEIVALGKRFIKEIGYSGLFSLEFLHSKDGGDYFLEMNFRNDANAYCVTKAGVNLPYIWVNRGNPMDLHNEIDKDINEVYLLPVFFELSMWGKGLISFRTLMSDIKKADFYADYSSDDPKPTYGRLRFYARFVKLLFMKCRNYFH